MFEGVFYTCFDSSNVLSFTQIPHLFHHHLHHHHHSHRPHLCPILSYFLSCHTYLHSLIDTKEELHGTIMEHLIDIVMGCSRQSLYLPSNLLPPGFYTTPCTSMLNINNFTYLQFNNSFIVIQVNLRANAINALLSIKNL